MLPVFIPATDDIPGVLVSCWGDGPQAFLTPDGKLLKLVWNDESTTYHLPETVVAVKFDDLSAAFHAAYGRPMED